MRPWNTFKDQLTGAAVIATLCLLSTAASADDRTDLESLLTLFLDGAATDIGVHQRFWADDLIYTSSAGQRFGKAKIIDGMQQAKTAEQRGNQKQEKAGPRYWAEDTQIQLYGDTAVVAFQLVAEETPAKSTREQKDTTQRFFNTGTFVKREGEWRAVAWQATRIPSSQPDA